MVTEMTKLTALTSSGGLRQCSNFNKSKSYSGLENGEGEKKSKIKSARTTEFLAANESRTPRATQRAGPRGETRRRRELARQAERTGGARHRKRQGWQTHYEAMGRKRNSMRVLANARLHCAGETLMAAMGGALEADSP